MEKRHVDKITKLLNLARRTRRAGEAGNALSVARKEEATEFAQECADVSSVIREVQTYRVPLQLMSVQSYSLGEVTFRTVFQATGMIDASDMRAFFDHIECVLKAYTKPPFNGEHV